MSSSSAGPIRRASELAGKVGQGDLTVIAGGSVDGRFLVRDGQATIRAGGSFGDRIDNAAIELFDAVVDLAAGGVTGQVGAIRLGIARALVGVTDEYKLPLRQAGLLTRDAREVERKKINRRKARKSEQYSKR